MLPLRHRRHFSARAAAAAGCLRLRDRPAIRLYSANTRGPTSSGAAAGADVQAVAAPSRPRRTRCIGIIGGMSPSSTELYYSRLNTSVRAALGGLHSADLLIRSVDFAEIEALQSAGDWDAAGPQLHTPRAVHALHSAML